MSWELHHGDVERFWSKVDQSAGGDACWPWLAGRDKDGYGKFQIGPNGQQKHLRAHRVALALAGRSPGIVTMHRCDNPSCCNPLHLIGATQTENRADCTRKGRNAVGDSNGARTKPESRPRGQAHHATTLSDDHAAEIRRRYQAGEAVGLLTREFGVSRSIVWRIGTGRRYAP